MTELLIASLAVWRMSRFIRKENGPACFMSRIRSLVCRRCCNKDGTDDGTLAEWFQCNKCCGFGVSLVGVLIWWWFCPDRWSIPMWVALPWCLSAAAILIELLDEINQIRAKQAFKREQMFDAAAKGG